MHYRADVDGLRAIAVLGVVLFHLGLKAIPGGYVGVDVFFVISGYLITRLIHEEICSNRYSIRRFYVRRARRIFPALFAMIAATGIAGIFFLYPPEIKDLQAGILSGTTFLSNMYFFVSADYFAGWVDSHPLLHVWSLAVEEQFYILFPLLLVGLARFQQRYAKSILSGLLTISFVFSVWLTENNPQANFYLLPSRSWELMAGAVLALYGRKLKVSSLAAEVLSVLGLMMIAFSMRRYTAHTPFPGVAALLPCMGAVLLILTGIHSRPLCSRILGSAPLRAIGLISYSLYLWHWPIIVFFRSRSLGPPLPAEQFQILALMLVVSALSWRFIEQPFRRKTTEISDGRVFAASVAAIIAINILALALGPLNAMYWPTDGRYDKIFQTVKYGANNSTRAGTCFLTHLSRTAEDFDKQVCLQKSTTKPNLLIIGDSHAAQYYAGLREVLPQFNIEQATASGCLPIIGQPGEPRCTNLMDSIYDDLLSGKDLPDIVVIAGRWKPGSAAQLQQTIARLNTSSIRPVILGPIVEYRDTLPHVLARAVSNGDTKLPAQAQSPEPYVADSEFKIAATNANFTYVSVIDAMCPKKDCLTLDNAGYPLQFDYGHLTNSGSIMVIDRIKSAFVNTGSVTNSHAG